MPPTAESDNVMNYKKASTEKETSGDILNKTYKTLHSKLDKLPETHSMIIVSTP